MSFTRIALVLAFTLSAASAQQFAQPVRDVEKEARSAVFGYCNPIILAGQTSTANVNNCSLGSVTGASFSNATVPAGKILVIEEASASCSKGATNTWAFAHLFPANGYGRRILPLELQGTENGVQRWATFTNGRLYAANTQVRSVVQLVDNATALTSCSIYFTGHVVDAQ